MKEKDDEECCTFITADEWEGGRLEEPQAPASRTLALTGVSRQNQLHALNQRVLKPAQETQAHLYLLTFPEI